MFFDALLSVVVAFLKCLFYIQCSLFSTNKSKWNI